METTASTPPGATTRSPAEIVESDATLLKKKQADYATGDDPWLNFREAAEFVSRTRGVTFNALDAAYFLLGLKVSRLKNLGTREPSNESKLDTLQDLRGYSAIIQAMEEEGAVLSIPNKSTFDANAFDKMVAEMKEAIREYEAQERPGMTIKQPTPEEFRRMVADLKKAAPEFGGSNSSVRGFRRYGGEDGLYLARENEDGSYTVREDYDESIGMTDDDDEETLEQEAERNKADADRVYRVLFNEDIGEVAALVHDIAVNKGWWDDVPCPGEELSTSEIAEKLLLIHTEVSEATEVLRETSPECLLDDKYDDNDKPIGFTSELADIIIRVLDLAAGMGIDIRAAMADKIVYNSTRSYRHGNKNL